MANNKKKRNVLKPQAGPQTQFMQIPPDIPLVVKSSGSTLNNPANSRKPQHVKVVVTSSRMIKFMGGETNV